MTQIALTPAVQNLVNALGLAIECTGKKFISPINIWLGTNRIVSISPLFSGNGSVHWPTSVKEIEFYGVYVYPSGGIKASWRADLSTAEMAIETALGLFEEQLRAGNVLKPSAVEKLKEVAKQHLVTMLKLGAKPKNGGRGQGPIAIAKPGDRTQVSVVLPKNAKNPMSTIEQLQDDVASGKRKIEVKARTKTTVSKAGLNTTRVKPAAKKTAANDNTPLVNFLDQQLALRKATKAVMGKNPVPKNAKPADPMANVREVKDLKEVASIAKKSGKRDKALLKG